MEYSFMIHMCTHNYTGSSTTVHSKLHPSGDHELEHQQKNVENGNF